MHEVLNNKRMWELKKNKKYYYNFVSDRKKKRNMFRINIH